MSTALAVSGAFFACFVVDLELALGAGVGFHMDLELALRAGAFGGGTRSCLALAGRADAAVGGSGNDLELACRTGSFG